MFLVPMDTPGVEVQALPTVGDERTNLTYYSDVRISATVSARSTTAGQCCTARWTPSTASAMRSASSTT
jgi:hypothetical protein